MPDAGDGAGLKKTQLGQGLFVVNRRQGTATEGSVRPENWSQDGAWGERCSSALGHIAGNGLRENCWEWKRPACEDLIADRRVVKLRPNRVTVAPQP